MHFGAPRDVLANEAGVYAELDEGILDVGVEGEDRRTEEVPSAATGSHDPFDLTLPPRTDDDVSAHALGSLPAIGLIALGGSGLRQLRRRREASSAVAENP
jgi:hypothetical protein